MPTDKWGHPFLYPTKTNGGLGTGAPFFYQQSNNVLNDEHFEDTNADVRNGSNGEFHISFGGSDSVVVLKNRSFLGSNSIGGCDMDFEATKKRGYGYRADDPRDIELKMVIRVTNAASGEGLSLKGPSGHHNRPTPCCQGQGYMFSIEDLPSSPQKFRFRKEMWHVNYDDDPDTGTWTHASVNFAMKGAGWRGICFVRYNKPNGVSPGKDSVILEAWFNPTPDSNKNNWIMLKRTEDKGGWGDGGNQCGGDVDQILTWSNGMFIIKGSDIEMDVKHLSLREINPYGSFDDDVGGGIPSGGSSGTATSDKWGIPFWYPTKKTAGITNSGKGFYWQQNNNFREDEDDGFLRLGKETDDCRLINGSTGEWEFPFLSEGDGLSVSGGTGHHSGGETHGCQGFAYMVDANFDNTPVTFRFRKETYHVQYNTDPQTGTWTSPSVTKPIVNTWKGIGWVRYNKPNGRPDGGDSVVLECWWNDNPTADIKNWKMIKRTEDKGKGVSNWGINDATCDGEPYQVGTWSAIQWRWKSAASDFSFHPIRPEWNEGDNIHAIGGEDMSFSDSEKRGYSLQSNIPRDTEMKGLFKWDAGGAGKCRFKNLSLREIDPFASFDDNPTPPTGGTSTLQGSFKVQWDVNNSRTSPCAGAGGGGGSGGSAIIYDQPVVSDKLFTSTRTRVGMTPTASSSGMVGKILKQLDVPLKKVGSPAASPTVSAKIYSPGGSLIYTSPTTFDPSTFTTDYVTKTFDFSTNTHIFTTNDKVVVQYGGTGSTDTIVCGYIGDSGTLTVYTEYKLDTATWTNVPSADFSCTMWE